MNRTASMRKKRYILGLLDILERPTSPVVTPSQSGSAIAAMVRNLIPSEAPSSERKARPR